MSGRAADRGHDDGHPDHGVPVPRPDEDAAAELTALLERSRELGFLGPGPVEAHVRHARGFVPLLPGSATVVDLGAGGGVPGLVLLAERPDLRMILLDASARRTDFLATAVDRLRAEARARVVVGRAEAVAREDRWRGCADAVVARSFGPPAATAECAVGFLRPGGRVLVSEPPEDADRWPAAGLAELGLARGHRIDGPGVTIQELRLEGAVADRWPRRDGVPARRPVF